MAQARNVSRLQKRLASSRNGKSHPIYQLTIPVAVVKELGLGKGDRFRFFSDIRRREIVLRKVES